MSQPQPDAATVGAPLSAEVVTVRPSGKQRHLTLSVPGEPGARPGQFLVLPPRPGAGTVLPGQWWLAGSRYERRVGTSWEVLLTETQAGEHDASWGPVLPGAVLPVRGPQGRGFALPRSTVPAVLVGDARAAGPLGWLARLLTERGCPVRLLLVEDGEPPDVAALGRQTEELVLRESADPGQLTEETGRLLAAARAPVAYAAGSPAVVRAVARAAASGGAHAQVTVYRPGA
ncbi:ferredoxin reductase domain-containing protein, partial [Ornithinicoccus halotolerans]|uniref:hypothetical protein n=1 Tax=Ornithinicoccus halotolerans TaxID=1748220 RepID=UPI00129488B5